MLWCNWLPLLLFVNKDCVSKSLWLPLLTVGTLLEYHTHTHTMWCVEVCESVVMVCVCVCGEGGEVRVNVNTVLCQFHVHTEVRLADCPTTVVSVWESVGTIPHYQLHWLFTERRARAWQETIISQLSNNVLLHAALVEGFLHETTQSFPQCTHYAHLVVLTCAISVTKVKTIGSRSCQSMFLTSGQNQLCKCLACISGEPVWHCTSNVPPSLFFLSMHTFLCVSISQSTS